MMDKKLDAKIQPLQNDIRDIKLKIENTIEPQLNLLTESYVPAAKKYEKESSKTEAMQGDIEIMKKVIQEHSQKLKNIS